MCFTLAHASLASSTTHQCRENGSPIQGPGQPIQGPIQRFFGLSCVRQVYFLLDYTEFHGMRTECQKINTSRSFLTVLIISRKSTVMDQSLTPWSLKNCSPIDPQSLPGLLNLWCWTSSLPQMSKTWTLLQIYTSLNLFPLRWINLQKICSLKIHQSDLAAPTHQTFCLLWIVQRDLLIHIPPHNVKTWFLCFLKNNGLP